MQRPGCLQNIGPKVTNPCFVKQIHSNFARSHSLISIRQRQLATQAKYLEEARYENWELQAETFNQQQQIKLLSEKQPENVAKSLHEIVQAVPNLGCDSRVLDVGSGTGVLIPYLAERQVSDILAVDVAEKMLKVIIQHNATDSLGNTRGVRTWLGPPESIPPYQGPFDAAFFNSVFGNILDRRSALLSTSLLLQPGGHIVLSHPLGRRWLSELHENNPEIVPHKLPDQEELKELITDLPLVLVDFRDLDQLYCAVLQVPKDLRFQRAPILLEEEVVRGFGRGSKQMGIPTANLRPEELFAGPLDGLPLGVYFGWAQLQGVEGEDAALHKTVLNIGKRPTIEDGEQRTIELHILHKFSGDFYGKRMKAVMLGFIRPEMKFNGLDALINRIKADIGIAKGQLDQRHQEDWAGHSFNSSK